jgi:hypothetical protein
MTLLLLISDLSHAQKGENTFTCIVDKMKKIFVAILAVIYLVTATGLTMHFHYCMGKLVSWGLTEDKTNTCSFCGMSKEDNNKQTKLTGKECCKDKNTVIKLDKEHNKTIQVLIPNDVHATVCIPIEILSATIAVPEKGGNVIHAPPARGQLPVFILNCVFII